MDTKSKSILDPTFRYVPSTATDIRKTFARVRREMKREQDAERDKRTLQRIVAFAKPVGKS